MYPARHAGLDALPILQEGQGVRSEYVIKAGRSARQFYCGGCNRQWEVTDDAELSREGSRDHADRMRRHDSN